MSTLKLFYSVLIEVCTASGKKQVLCTIFPFIDRELENILTKQVLFHSINS